MRFRDIWILGLTLLVGIGLLIAAGRQLDAINQQRVDMKLVINEPLDNAPPSLAFATVAMGAFRGLVVDILWIRADQLKEEGKFFDARQLAEWIATLQPRFATVWVFHAWNMAYNISVAVPASQPEQRWRWVRNGYELLRDKGLQYNPRSIAIYHELARILQHKVGGVTDEDHKYYKIQMARALEPLVGGVDQAFFDAAVAAPKTWNELVADPNMAGLVADFQKADPAFTEGEAFVKSYFALQQEPQRFSKDANDVLAGYQGSPLLFGFDVFARAFELRTTWKMDVAFMRQVNRRYGPVDFDDPNHILSLDWRHPDVHAIYWAAKGLQAVSEDRTRDLSTEEMNTDRIVIHSLQSLFRSGKMSFFTVPVYPTLPDGTRSDQPEYVTDLFLRPDLRMFDRYNDAAVAMMKKYGDDRGRVEALGNGYRNMLKNAVLSFYQSRLYGQALRIYKMLQEFSPDRPELQVSLAEFARRRFVEEVKEAYGINDAREQILGLLKESYYLYAIQSDDEAYGRQKLAEELRDYYMKEFGESPQDNTGRVDLPDMKELKYLSAVDFLQDPGYPPYLKQNFLARMYTESPELYEQFQKMELQNQKEEARKKEGN